MLSILFVQKITCEVDKLPLNFMAGKVKNVEFLLCKEISLKGKYFTFKGTFKMKMEFQRH